MDCLESMLANVIWLYSPRTVAEVIASVNDGCLSQGLEVLKTFVFQSESELHDFCAKRNLWAECELLERYLSDMVWREVVQHLMGE